MKKPIIDLAAARMAESLAKQSFINRFIRYWGTVVVDGVEVLDHRRIFWDRWSGFNHGSNTDKLMRLLKAYDSIRQSSYNRVYYSYLYLNPNKGAELGDELVAANLSKAKAAVGSNPKFEVKIHLEHAGKKLDLGSSSQTNSQLLTNIRAKADIINAEFPIEANYDKYVSTLASYGLLYGGSVKINSAFRSIVKNVEYSTDYDNNSYAVSINIPVVVIGFECSSNDFTDGSVVVTKIVNDYKTGTGVGADATRRLINSGSVNATENSAFSLVGYDVPSPALPELWHNSYAFGGHPPGTRWYLKASVLRDYGLSLDEKIELITSILDSDAEVEDSSWGLFSIFVVIVAIVAAKFTGGVSLKLIATAVVTFAAVITIGAALAQGLGLDSEAQKLGEVSSMIAPIVMVASLVLLGDAVSNGIQALKEGVAQAQLESSLAAAGYSSFEGLSSTMMDQVVEAAITKVTNLKMDKIIGTVNQVVGMVNGNKLEELRKDISRKEDRLKAQQAELDELNNDDGVLMRAIQIGYANQLNQDWSSYNEMETMYNPTRWNTQATKVGALMGMGINTYYGIPVGKE